MNKILLIVVSLYRLIDVNDIYLHHDLAIVNTKITKTTISDINIFELTSFFQKRRKVSYHNLERDKAQIAELIENDPYFAAATEDLAYTHGLSNSSRCS
jgi:hypothetical protein